MTPKLSRDNRVGRVAKWLRQQSENPLLTELHLETETDGEASSRVGTWHRTKTWDPQQVAQDIEDTLSAIMAEQETRVVARLVLMTESGQRWTTFPLRLEPENGTHPLDGTSKSMAIQAQRHLEGMAVTWGRSTQSILEKYDGIGRTYTATMDALARVLETRENRTAHLEAELARLRDENAELQAQAMQTEAMAEQAIETAEQASEQLAARKDSASTDGQMLQLLTRVAQDAVQAPQRPAKPPPKAGGSQAG